MTGSIARLLTLATCCTLAACDPHPDLGARARTVVSVIARADLPLIRSRPRLVAGKYALMASDPIAFFRGSLALGLYDLRTHSNDTTLGTVARSDVLVWAIGDPHPENFGTLVASDGTFSIEPNDFDAADAWPWLWDLHRFLTGIAVAAASSNSDDATARAAVNDALPAIVRSAASAYVDELAAVANGGPRFALVDAPDDAILTDVFDRARRDATPPRELESLTALAGTTRRFVRGAPDATDPSNVLADLPSLARDAIPDVLRDYRATLLAPPPAEFFTVLDAVREFGSGVASWPRVRALVLVRGATDDSGDDVVLEVKEIGDSGVDGWIAPGVSFDSPQSRVVRSARALWSRPDADPLFGSASWLGLPVVVRREREAHKGVRVRRWTGARGTPAAITSLAIDLARLVARCHATAVDPGASPARAIVDAISNERDPFVASVVADALRDAQQVLVDHASFAASIATLGRTLGIEPDESDLPRPDLAALFESGLPEASR